MQPRETHPTECRPGYAGSTCDDITDACLALDPCENHGICENKGTNYICNCPIHYSGDQCQFPTPVKFSSQYNGNGFVELNRSAIVQSDTEVEILIAIMFSTQEPNGLLVWYGQNKSEPYNGNDFVALAIVDGYLEFAFRLQDDETSIQNPHLRVDDGKRHIAVVTRNGNKGTLEVDNTAATGDVAESSSPFSHLPGNLFLGMINNICFFPFFFWGGFSNTFLFSN